MQSLWNNFIYDPIYNILVFVAQKVSMGDVGLAVVIVTILIRLALLPLSKKTIISQQKTKLLEPKLQAIKAKGLSKEDEAKETFALYKTEKINPLSGCLYLLIQIPFLFALYFVFSKGIDQPEHLYSFLNTEGLKNTLLGLVDITKPFLPFAILAGVTQAIQAFVQAYLVAPKITGDEKSFQNQFAKSMTLQTKYVLPIIIIFVAKGLASAVSLYWIVANTFTIFQDLYLKRAYFKKKTTTEANN